jgi:Sulfotransferase domain
MRVAFVVCPAYHGATLLDLLLNNHPCVSALGECSFPEHDFDPVCSCRELVSECSFWTAVAEGLGDSSSSQLPDLLPPLPWPLSRRRVEGNVVRISRHPRLNRTVGSLARVATNVAMPILWRSRRQHVENFVATYRSFYGFVLDRHKTSVFIDGYKSWRKAALLASELQPAVDIRIIHLVRDPRGFAASRRRHDRRDVRESAWMWRDLHRRATALGSRSPYLLLRYEGLCASPVEEMGKLFVFLGLDRHSVVSAPKYPEKHHVLGNEMARSFSGDVTCDERWRSELTTTEQRTVLAAAGDLAEQFGYGVGD